MSKFTPECLVSSRLFYSIYIIDSIYGDIDADLDVDILFAIALELLAAASFELAYVHEHMHLLPDMYTIEIVGGNTEIRMRQRFTCARTACMNECTCERVHGVCAQCLCVCSQRMCVCCSASV